MNECEWIWLCHTEQNTIKMLGPRWPVGERNSKGRKRKRMRGKRKWGARNETPLHGAVIFHLERFSLGCLGQQLWPKVVGELNACGMQLQSDQATTSAAACIKKKLLSLSASHFWIYKGFPYFWPLNNKKVSEFWGFYFMYSYGGLSMNIRIVSCILKNKIKHFINILLVICVRI